MTDEEAIKRIKYLQQDECNCEECTKDKEAYEIVLNLIEKKDKIIELMSIHIDDCFKKKGYKICNGCKNKKCKDCVIEYFEKEEV